MPRRKIDLTRPVRKRSGEPVHGLRKLSSGLYRLTTAQLGTEPNVDELWMEDGRQDQTTYDPKPGDLLNYDRWVTFPPDIHLRLVRCVDDDTVAAVPVWTDPITLAWELNTGDVSPASLLWL